MKLSYYGHSAFMVELGGKKLLFDPFITGNELAKDKVDISQLEPDFILLSHAHADHLGDTVTIAKATGATVVAHYEICSWMNKKGVEKTHPLGIGGKFEFDFGTVKMTVAQHSSSFPDGSYGGNPNGFIVKGKEKTFYYSGDTGLTMDMQLIPQFAACDFVVLPIGDNYTMGVEDAILAAKMIGSSTVLGVHYDTFDFIGLNRQRAMELFNNNGLDLKLPGIGETIEI